MSQEQLVEFNQLAIEHANGHEDMLNRVMTKDNIALAALLQTKEACWENGVPPDHKVINIQYVTSRRTTTCGKL